MQDALSKGAVAACGGGRPHFEAGSPLAGGYFFEPTVLTGGRLESRGSCSWRHMHWGPYSWLKASYR